MDQVSGLDRDTFVERFGTVFEASPWVAESAWATRPWASVDELHAAMVAAVRAAPRERRRNLLRAHPDLSERAARPADLAAASAAEQAAAGLDDVDTDSAARLAASNRAYRERFGFPFIVCAREHTPQSILASAETRLRNEPGQEEQTALAEVFKIARLRLEDLT